MPQLFPFHWTEEGFLLPEIKILYRKFCILSSLRKFSDSRNLELEIDELSNYQRGKNQDWPNLKKKKKFRSLLSFFEETNSINKISMVKKVKKKNKWEKCVYPFFQFRWNFHRSTKKLHESFWWERNKEKKTITSSPQSQKKKTRESLSPYFFNQVKKVTK